MIRHSIIICTYNRYSFLKETLKSLLHVLDKRNNYEILVIDNNSNDAIADLVNEFDQHNFLKYFLETKQGLSHARNRGIIEAKGEILIFLDDDIEIETNYFECLEKAFSHAHIDIVGGKVLPFKILIPDWLPPRYYYLASIFDLGDHQQIVEKVMGANYAMRNNVAQDVGWYNPELGRKANQLLGGEEIDYLDRASKKGYIIYYRPELIVYHKINDKLTKQYILEYALSLGISELTMDKQKSMIKMLLKYIKCLLDIFLHKSIGNYIPSAQRQMNFHIKYKYAIGYLKIAHSR